MRRLLVTETNAAKILIAEASSCEASVALFLREFIKIRQRCRTQQSVSPDTFDIYGKRHVIQVRESLEEIGVFDGMIPSMLKARAKNALTLDGQHGATGRTCALRVKGTAFDQRPCASKYFSTSSAAMHPDPAAVIACLYLRSLMSPAQKTPGNTWPLRVQWTSSLARI